jgi:hypothetical protein
MRGLGQIGLSHMTSRSALYAAVAAAFALSSLAIAPAAYAGGEVSVPGMSGCVSFEPDPNNHRAHGIYHVFCDFKQDPAIWGCSNGGRGQGKPGLHGWSCYRNIP